MTSISSSEELVRLRAGEIDAGTLLDTHLARILHVLGVERATGVLEIDAGGQRTGFYLREGVTVFAEAGTVGDTLGRVLVRAGTITEAQYGAILRRMTDALVHDELMRFGEVAVELGILSPEDVSAGLARQVRAKLARCLQLDHGRWVFRDDPDAVARVARFPCPLGPALIEALADPAEAARWVTRLAPLGAWVAALAEDVSSIAERLALPPAALRVVRAMDGGRSLDEIVQPSAPGAEARAATAATLLLLELAQLRLPTAKIPSVVPLAPAIDPSADLHAAARSAAAAEALRAEFERRRAAMTARSAPQQRQEQRSRLSAEQHYAEGRKFLREGKLPLALRELTLAAEAMPEAIEYQLAAALATWLTDDEALARRVHEDVLRERVVEALRADKQCAIAHYAQGRLHAAADDQPAALKAFAIAAKLDPQDVELQRWLRLTRSRVR